jgi:hypothetical protein
MTVRLFRRRHTHSADRGALRSRDKIAGLYVYQWAPTEIGPGQITASGSMRQHVKEWITT